MSTIKLTFGFERETKGAVRFQELDENGVPQAQAFSVIGTLYIRKNALGKGNVPSSIAVELTTYPQE